MMWFGRVTLSRSTIASSVSYGSKFKLTSSFLSLLFLALVRVACEERFVEQPEDSVVPTGTSQTLKCSVADLVGSVQWLRDGFGLGPGQTFEGYPRYQVQNTSTDEGVHHYHLHISSVDLEDDAVFECQVGRTASTSGLMSKRAKVTVQVPADDVRIEEGTSVEIVSGEPSNLTCIALNGKPAPNVSWSSDPSVQSDFIVTTSVTQQGATKREDVTSHVTFVPGKSDEGGVVSCDVINPAMKSARRASVTLHVLYKPEVKLIASPAGTIKEFESLTLQCSATANPSSITWRWFRGSALLAGETNPTLRVASVTRALHNTSFTCEATNRVGSARQAFTINLQYGPRFITEPHFPAASVGDEVTLSCDVDSNPPAAVIWRRKGLPRILSSRSTLRIERVIKDYFDNGFICTVSASHYDELHRYVRILEKGVPKIISSPNQEALYGSTGLVECVIEGVPSPSKVTWSKNGEEIDFIKFRRYKALEEDLPNAVRKVLEITSVQDSDFASYTCTALNDHGTDSLTIKFTKKDVVPLAYIISGVFIGALIVGALIVVAVLYRRRAHRISSSESGSSGSDGSTRKIGQPNMKIDFSTDESIDAWQQKNLLDNRNHPITEYDELRYPVVRDTLGRDYPEYEVEGYGGYNIPTPPEPFYRSLPRGHHAFENPYGTHPRVVEGSAAGGIISSSDPRSERIYSGGSDIYRPHGAHRHRFDYANPSDFLPPPPKTFDYSSMTAADSNLATNV